MIEASLVTRINGDATISALVGDRVRPLIARQNEAKPYIVYQLISDQRESRPLQGPNGHVRATYQFTVWATGVKTAKTIGDKLRLRLDGLRGVVGDHYIDDVALENRVDGWEFETEGSETILFSDVHTYRVWYAEAVS